jgi:hypothetical protein
MRSAGGIISDERRTEDNWFSKGLIMVRFALKMPLNSPSRRYQVEFPFGRLPVHSTVTREWIVVWMSPAM